MYRQLFALTLLFLSAGCSLLPHQKKTDVALDTAEEQKAAEPLIVVNVAGVAGDVAANIMAYAGIARSPCSTPLRVLKLRNKKTVTETIQALQAFGYYEAEVETSLRTTGACPVVDINIRPGRRMHIETVQVRIIGPAAEDRNFGRAINALPVKTGLELNHGDYDNAKSMIESAAISLGYLEGHFTEARLEVDIAAYAAGVYLAYSSGVRYRLGRIGIMQDPATLDEDLIRRIMEVPAGAYYSTDEIIRIQNRLAASNYFRNVEVRPRLSSPEGDTVPVDVVLTPADRHRFEAAMGYSTDDGLRSRLAYTNRLWNSHGHRLGGEILLAQIEQGFSANYQVPRGHPSNEWLNFAAGLFHESVDTYETITSIISVDESRRRPWGVLENHYLRLSRDDFEVGGEDGIGTFLIPGVRWQRRTVDDELNPGRGLDLSLEVKGAAEALVSDTDFLGTIFHIHYLHALPLGFRALVRSDLGGMWVDKFRALPPSERFFAGGDNSIRGYDFLSLGPVNEDGRVIGGPYLGVFSFELEKHLTGNWGVAAFVDTGNAFGGPGRDTGIKTGVGAGLRWRSPVGPVRIDLAHPLDDENTLLRLHIRIGTDL